MAQHDLRATFTKGEVTPLVRAREDLELYKQGLALLRNFTVLKQGGVRRRSGTRYYGPTKGTGKTALIPFIFNDAQSFALEFGATYIRFWNENGQILEDDATTIYEIASPYTADQVGRVQWAQANDVLYLSCPDVKPKQLNRLDDNSWTLTDVDFQDGPYLPVNDTDNTVNWTTLPVKGASVVFTHTTTDFINGGSGFASTDVGRHYRVQTLGVWVWGVITTVTNTKTITVTIKNSVILAAPSGIDHWLNSDSDVYREAAGNTVQEVGKDSGTGNVAHNFTAADIGKVFPAKKMLSSNTDDAYVRITRICTDYTLEFVIIGKTNAGVTNSATFQLGAFSDTTGYPGSVAFFDGRLCWARTKSNPRGVALSVSGTPTVYSPTLRDGTVVDNLGMFEDVTAGKSDEFHWLADGARLLIGSPSSLRSLGPSDDNAGLSPKNVKAKLEIPTGSTAVVPVQIGGNTFHTKRFGQGVINLGYDFNVGGIVGPEQSILSEHLYHSPITKFAYVESPEGVIWTRSADGTLTGMTFDAYEKVVGFHRHPMINGSVQDILGIPSDDKERDLLFLIVKRTIDGSEVQYVEVLDKPFYNDDKAEAFFVDCGATYRGSPTSIITGLDFLEGETVSLLVDGAVYPNVVVTDGQITIPNGGHGSIVHVGLPIDARFTMLPVAISMQEGNQHGLAKRIVYAILDLLETRGGKVGIDGFTLEDIMHRRPSDPMGQAPALFTGTTEKLTFDDEHDSQSQLTIVCDQPLPMTVRAINLGIEARQ